jgi:NAD(P)-dependent dehydrogenase (short-subunit alcohol dehydrogenase family)
MSVFLVTGASRGLGREIVRAALAAGHEVVAGVRDVHALDDLGDGTGRLIAVGLDVTDEAAAQAAVTAAVDRFGRLDVLVNNAGYANVGSIEDVDPADFRAQVETNLFGVVNLTRAALPVLREQGSGHIVQVSSVGGRLATGRARGVPDREVGGRRLLVRARRGGRAAGDPGDGAGAGRDADGLGGVVDADRPGPPGVRRHGRGDGAPALRRRDERERPGEGGRTGAPHRGDGLPAATAAGR